jgi:PDDEXK-like uncharacterized protein DUF3799
MESKIYIGGRIMEPGIYARVPMSRYHEADICDGPSLSSSGMRSIIWDSEADYWDNSPLNPDRKDVDEDDARSLILGRAVHHLTLGEPFFTKLFVQQPDEYDAGSGKGGGWKKWSNNAGKCKEWHAEQRALGKTALTASELERVRGMMLSLGRYPLIRAGILNGQIERSGFWKDKKTGIWLKIRPDVIPTDSDDASDFKTTVSVQWLALQKTIETFAYFQQGALVREGWRILFGRELNSFTLVFVQSRRPYSCRTVTLEPEDLDRGEQLNRQAIDRFVACLKSKTWPGPGGFQSDAQSLALSQRARERIDDIIKYGNIL